MDAELKHQNADQPLRQQNHDQNNLNSGFGYTEDDFIFDPTTSFNNDWETPILDPALHNGFQPQAWTQPSHQTVPNNGYGSPFPSNQSYPGYAGFSSNPYQSIPSDTYSNPISYPNGSIIQQSGFSNSPNPSFIVSNPLSGETIAPSAIQSYPGAYERFSPHSDRTTTPLQTESHITPAPSVSKADKFYDENNSELYASKVPIGKPIGALTVKGAEELCKAAGATHILVHLYTSNDALESDEPRVMFPRIPSRKSVKEVKQETLDFQNDRPWDPSQKSMLKKIRIKLAPGKRGRPRKDAPTTSAGATTFPILATTSSSSELVDVDSSSESSSEGSENDSATEDSEEEEPSPLPKVRPKETKGGLEYDVIKAIWARRDTMLSGAVIKSALSEYLEIVKSVRETFKSASTALAAAEAAKSMSDVEKAKATVTEARDSMQHVLQVTLKHGHPDIVERFGSSPLLISIFYTFLLDRFNKADYNGQTSEAILKLLSSCTTLNQDLLEKTRFDKILPRFVRKSNEQMKRLAQQVLDNAANMSKPKAIENKTTKTEESVKKVPTKLTVASETAGVKRSQPSETAVTQPTKKPSQPAPPRAGPAGISSKPSQSSVKTVTTKSTLTTKGEIKGSLLASKIESPPKSKAAPFKAPSLLSGLKSASKKPVVSGEVLRAPPTTDSRPTKTEAPKLATTKPASAPTPAPKSTFSFSQALADLGKPKPAQESKQATKDRPPETEEEKRKRERKEARRKLRVTFKPAETLEEIRLFHHDPEEDQGHDRSMLRGVSDMKDEGRMLKLYSKRVDLDEEEEYEPQFDEDELIPWQTPSQIDLSDADYNTTMSHYVTRGGPMEVESAEREIQEQHERNTLIAIYPSLADIPPTPREPADPYSGPTSQEVAFGPPNEDIRARESQFYAQRSQTSLPVGADGTDINAILRLLSTTAQQPSNPYPQAQSQAPIPQYAQPHQQSSLSSNNIESVFAQFSNPNPVPNPVSQHTSMDPSIQAALNIFSSQQQHTAAPQQAPPPATTIYAQQPQPNVNYPDAGTTQDLNAILSQISGLQNTSGGDRKRPLEGIDQYNQDAKRNKGGLYKYKTQPCRFYKEGTCDYCDVYLTHDSMSVRKAHNSGKNHLRNVVDYYQQIGHEKAQSVIDSITSSYADAGQAGQNPMIQAQQAAGGPGFPPPPFGMPGMPPFPGGGPPPNFPPPNMPGGRGMPFPFPPPAGSPGVPPGGMPFPPPGAMPPDFARFPPPNFQGPPPHGGGPSPGGQPGFGPPPGFPSGGPPGGPPGA